jgi:O-antigen/teichoic acid export membrane protein
MSTRKTLIKNTFWLSLVELFSKVIMFVVTITIIRYLGPNIFGAYNFAFSFVALLMIVSDLGVGTIVSREVAKHKDMTENYLGNALGLRTVTSIVIMVVTLISLLFLGSNSQYWLLVIISALYNLSQQFFGMVQSILTAHERMEYLFGVKLVYYLGIMAAAFATTRFDLGVNGLVLLYLLVGLLSVGSGLLAVSRLGVKIRVIFDFTFWKELLVESLPLFGFIACSQIYGNLDTLLIGRSYGTEGVGIYQSAYKILFAFQSINVINAATFPRMAVLIHEGREQTLNRLIFIIIAMSMLGLVPLILLINWKSEVIVQLIYGKKYLAAAPIMVNLVIVGGVNYFRIFATNLLVARGKQKSVFIAVLVGTVVNAILNYWLIPIRGFEFASISLLVSESLILIVSTMFLIRNKAQITERVY